MGEFLGHKESILITLPIPEPTELVERLRQKWKHVEVIYREVSWPSANRDQPEVEEIVKAGNAGAEYL